MPLSHLVQSTIIDSPTSPSEPTLRIGVDARLADYTLGGIARYTVQLLAALRRLAARHQLVAVRARRPKVAPPELAVDEALAAYTPPHHRLERFVLPWELRSARLDVLHSPDFIPPKPSAWRSVITVHDLAYLRMPGLLTGASRRYYGAIHRAVREADAIIAVSQATANDLAELVGAPREKLSVVYEAADSTFKPMPRDDAAAIVREKHRVEGPYILFVGTLEPRKNLPMLLQAFASLRREFPVRLVVAGGNGWLSDDVFSTVQRLALDDGVVFLGDVLPADLRPLYCAATVLALPSLYEGFGLPPLEAMACGTPVVVSNAGALPEVVGDAGVLVRPEDPEDIANGLGWVLGNERYRELLAQRGLARAAAFSWDRAAQETMAVYERVAAG
jgi:glycosyltransferase involved in cell wall biosynthesis